MNDTMSMYSGYVNERERGLSSEISPTSISGQGGVQRSQDICAFVVGGTNEKQRVMNSVESFNLETRVWRKHSPMN